MALPTSWAVEGRAMRRAIASDFRALDGIDVVTMLDERFQEDEPAGEIVRIGPGEEEAALARLTKLCDYTVLIAPETGGILAERASLIEESGGRSLGSSPSAVALTADKLRLGRHLMKRGIRTVRTESFQPVLGLPRDFPYPAVVKPIDGAGSLHTYYCKGPEDHPFAPDSPHEMIIQPYCPGTPLSATFLVGRSGTIRLIGVGRQNIEIREGLLHYAGGRLPEPVTEAIEGPFLAVQSVLGLGGIVGVDYVQDATGETTVIEINPRPTTSCVGLMALRPAGSIARAWLDLFEANERQDDLRGMIDPVTAYPIHFSPDGTIFREANVG